MPKKNKILMKMNPLSVAEGLRELVRNLLESLLDLLKLYKTLDLHKKARELKLSIER